MKHRKIFIFTFWLLIKITILNAKEIQNKIVIIYQDETNMNSSLTKNTYQIIYHVGSKNSFLSSIHVCLF